MSKEKIEFTAEELCTISKELQISSRQFKLLIKNGEDREGSITAHKERLLENKVFKGELLSILEELQAEISQLELTIKSEEDSKKSVIVYKERILENEAIIEKINA